MPDWQPSSTCEECRIGRLTEPCKADDVRRIRDPLMGPMWSAEPPVRPYRNHVVQGEGPVPCPLVGVGEGPGFHEDREGKPFRPGAPAGRELMKALREAGVCRWLPTTGVEINGREDTGWFRCNEHENMLHHPDTLDYYFDTHENLVKCRPIYLTNVVKCRPLDNKIKNFPDGVEYCSEHYLFPELEAVQPKAIVAFGLVPAALWFGKQDRAYRQLASGVVVLHAPHPSSIARGNRPAFERLVKVLKDAREIAYG